MMRVDQETNRTPNASFRNGSGADAPEFRNGSIGDLSRSDIADIMAGGETRNALEAFALADLAFAQSELAEREIRGKPLSPGDKMRIGLMRHDLESKIGRKIDTDGHVIDADGNPTGETFEERLDRLYPGGPLPEGFTFVETDGSEVNAD